MSKHPYNVTHIFGHQFIPCLQRDKSLWQSSHINSRGQSITEGRSFVTNFSGFNTIKERSRYRNSLILSEQASSNPTKFKDKHLSRLKILPCSLFINGIIVQTLEAEQPVNSVTFKYISNISIIRLKGLHVFGPRTSSISNQMHFS